MAFFVHFDVDVLDQTLCRCRSPGSRASSPKLRIILARLIGDVASAARPMDETAFERRLCLTLPPNYGGRNRKSGTS
jgi:hypothetical protein